MYLFDTLPQRPPVLDPDHEFAAVGDILTDFVLIMFLKLLLSNSPQNRNWLPMQEWPYDPTTTIDEPSIPANRHFPCPFYIYNPEKHLKCFTRVDLIAIKDVKQHLWNAHQIQPYCPTCGETFTITADSETHIRNRSCSPRGIPRPEGINLQQMQQLAQRAEDQISEDLQWLAIWKITFPGAEIPEFTHPSRTIEFVVCGFRDYWSSRGETVIYDFLEEKGLRNNNSDTEDEQRNLLALHTLILDQAIDRLVENFKNEDDKTISTKTEEVLASLQSS